MENLTIATGSRREKYEALVPQLKALWDEEISWVGNLANAAACLHQTFGFHWIGFYKVEKNELQLGPFQGPLACTRIGLGKGVCGTAWKEEKTQLVPDVDAFPGHIACSSLSRSEIVVPIKNQKGEIWGVLDIDSAELNDFSEEDRLNLEELARFWAALLA